jgi:hypothetical protein
MGKKTIAGALFLTILTTGCASRFSDTSDLRSPAAVARKPLGDTDKRFSLTSMASYYAISGLDSKSSLEEAFEICQSISGIARGMVFQHSVEAVAKKIAPVGLLNDATKYSAERVAFEIDVTIDGVDLNYSKIEDIRTDIATGRVRTETLKPLLAICKAYQRIK